jgi:hypothetical protein
MQFVSAARRRLQRRQEIRRTTMFRAIEIAIEKIEAILYPVAKTARD